MDRTVPRPLAFHVMAKPTGARCNLRCDYCFFLEKETLYSGSDFRMSEEVLEAYLRQVIEGHDVPQVTVAWQGGEPTLMGLDFFRRAVELERSLAPPGVAIEHTLQTNGVLLDDEWAEFLRENRFLVGLSLDGPRELHDAYRHDRRGESVFDRVVAAARLLQRHGVDTNILCTVNALNSQHPLEVYRFFRDELRAEYLQLIPIVEVEHPARVGPDGSWIPGSVTDRSVQPEVFGDFLVHIFDEWVRTDVGRVFVQTFDGILAAYVRGRSSLCVFQPTCGEGVALEHTGDVYSCDHFVDPAYLLGNILERPLRDLVTSEQQREFGTSKATTLPDQCRRCRFLFACNGECPKNRLLITEDGQPGLNWLCAGLTAFLEHVEHPMRLMADLLRHGRNADEVMGILEHERQAAHAQAFREVGRNDPCPCGSGLKFKRCCQGRPLSGG
jgi:uncharacterized protein